MSASTPSQPTDSLLQAFLAATNPKYTAIRERRDGVVSGLRDKLIAACRALKNPDMPVQVGLPIHYEDQEYFENYAKNIHEHLDFPHDPRAELSAKVSIDETGCLCDDDRYCRCPTSYRLFVWLTRVRE